MSIIKRWIKSSWLYPGMICFKLPIYLGILIIPGRFPCLSFSAHFINFVDPSVKTLPHENIEFNFSHIQPTSVFWCNNKFKSIPDRFCKLRGGKYRTKIQAFVSPNCPLLR